MSKAAINVIFKSHVNESYKEAVRFGAKIATEAFKPKVPINAEVFFVNKTNEVLGSARATSFQPVNNHFMTVAMAKQFGAIVRTNEPDIRVWVRLNHTWNLDPNRTTASGETFMPDVVVHELYHGLIFFARGVEHVHNKTTGRHAVRIKDTSTYYFEHLGVETAHGDCSLLSYLNEPLLMGDALTSDAVWFCNRTHRIAKVHAPTKYKRWSYIHIDPHQSHASMKSYINRGSELRGIGPYVAGIQKAMMQSEGQPRICNASDPRFFPFRRVEEKKSKLRIRNLKWILPVSGAVFLLLAAMFFAFSSFRHRNRVSAKEDEDDSPC